MNGKIERKMRENNFLKNGVKKHSLDLPHLKYDPLFSDHKLLTLTSLTYSMTHSDH